MNDADELIRAMLDAPPQRRAEALRILRGESPAPSVDTLPPPTEPYLTLKEVAKRLGLNPTTLWRWRIPGHELGGRRRFRLPEVVAYLESDEFKRRMSALRATRRAPKERK